MADEIEQTEQTVIQKIVCSKIFERLAAVVILVNAILIGVHLNYTEPHWVDDVQQAILFFFVAELIFRFIGKVSMEDYRKDGWNYFDIIIVAVSLIPPTLFGGAEMSVIRILRILRIFRLLRQIEELRLITSVLLRSVQSLGYSSVLFLIFMYVYAVIGVSLFKLDDYAASVNAQLNPSNPDPYGSLGEAMFSLFRILTGEDWTDLRYNLLAQLPDQNLSITLFHVSWMILAAFLLVNLVVGAVINNYDRMMEEVRDERVARAAEESKDGEGA